MPDIAVTTSIELGAAGYDWSRHYGTTDLYSHTFRDGTVVAMRTAATVCTPQLLEKMRCQSSGTAAAFTALDQAMCAEARRLLMAIDDATHDPVSELFAAWTAAPRPVIVGADTAPLRHVGTVTAWRHWYVIPSETRPKLYAPIWPLFPSHLRDHLVVDSREVRAFCIPHALLGLPQHEPPAPNCKCGVYAMSTFVQARDRLHIALKHVRKEGLPAFLNYLSPPTWAPKGWQPVLARVRLHDAVWYPPPEYPPPSPPGKPAPELRAAVATIDKLYLPPEIRTRHLADRLTATLTVPASVLPRDWRTIDAPGDDAADSVAPPL